MQPDFSVFITPDGLKAYLQIPLNVKVFPNVKELQMILQNFGVISGIDQNVLTEIASGKHLQGTIEIAKGNPPRAGIPGRIELLVDISNIGKPQELQNGRVDHHEIGTVINVSKGVPVAHRIPPVSGVDGRNVFGKPIESPLPVDVEFGLCAGTCISPEDPNILLSEIDGALSMSPEGIIEIKNEKIIEKDIDYSTGNVKFAGDLLIRGSVRAGFFVEVDGNLHIMGNVEDTRIKSSGNVIIEGGAVGAGTGIIESKGSVKVRHLENFSIKSNNSVIVSEDVLHCTICSEGQIKAKAIVGGDIAGFGIECDTIGSTAETKTIIDVGMMHLLSEERISLKKKNVEISDQIKNLKKQSFELVRDSMSDEGKLSELDEKKLASIKALTIESKETCGKINQRIEIIDKIEQTIKSQCGIIAKCIFPNTLIRFGNGERQVQEILNNVKFLSGSNG